MAFEDIDKLKDRLAKDPGSKLFVPLSEEYRKAGMFDEAIAVLQKGLEMQPSYMSARVALGKIFLEKGMHAESKDEFEKVIKAIPDNLFAHKKLAEIYKDLGDPEKAIEHYETVVRLNPLDEDAKINIEVLTGEKAMMKDKPKEEKPKDFAPPPPPKPKEPEPLEDLGEEIGYPVEANQAQVPEGADFEAFKKSIFSAKAAPESETPEKSARSEGREEPRMFFTGEDHEKPGSIPEFEEQKEEPGPPRAVTLGEGFPGLVSEEVRAESMMDEQKKAADAHEQPEPIAIQKAPERSAEPKTPGQVAVRGETALPKTPAPTPEKPQERSAPQQPAVAEAGPAGDIFERLRHAEEHINREQFSKALQVYNDLLRQFPGERRVLQKVQELKTYLKMIGRDKDEIVGRLESLLNAIMERKNEFFRGA